MNYAFPSDVANLVDLQLKSGQFSNPDDVLRAALRALQDRQADIAAIAAGYADLEAGRTHTFEEVSAEIEAKYGFVDEP